MRASGYATRNFNKQTCPNGKAAAEPEHELVPMPGAASKPSNWHPGRGGKMAKGDRERERVRVRGQTADCC